MSDARIVDCIGAYIVLGFFTALLVYDHIKWEWYWLKEEDGDLRAGFTVLSFFTWPFVWLVVGINKIVERMK